MWVPKIMQRVEIMLETFEKEYGYNLKASKMRG